MTRIHPVVLCGGTGSRLWPVSRQMFPKQFLPLVGDRPMLEETLLRIAGPEFEAPIMLANDEHRFIVAEQLRQAGIAPHTIYLEPFGRNTAPAAAIAALTVAAAEPDGLILVMPSDHVIADTPAFLAAVHAAAEAATTGSIVTFGITADYPETGYGYIKAGAPLFATIHRVARFTEKPDRETAERYLAEGNYYWNSGIFLFSARLFLEELARLQPGILAACRAVLDHATRDADFCRILPSDFEACPSLSIDYAVMEHTERAAVLPVSMGWNDVGAWPALWSLGTHDEHGNVIRGDVLTEKAENCYIRSEDGLLTAVVGAKDLVVIVADDAVFVSSRDHAQDVKLIVDRLKTLGRPEYQLHSTVYRPWGSYHGIDRGQRFLVKQITVSPGAKLSLQKHHHRAEHWIVVEGTAEVTRGDESFLLCENESTFIPIGTIHQLGNPGKIPLRIIEVQSGAYLEEDDIVRLQDSFGRV